MKQNVLWEKLAEYFAGELSENERQKMKSWIEADPKREEKVRQLHEVWKRSGRLPYPLDVDQAWYTLSGSMDQLDKSSERIDRPIPARKVSGFDTAAHRSWKSDRVVRYASMVAALAIIVLMAGFFTIQYGVEEQKVAVQEESGSREITTRNGEQAVFVLGDDSRVILHAGSRLEVPSNFNDSSRELYLEGEAYFEVTHDADKPFIVHSDYAYTRVLGTRFLVQAWAGLTAGVEVVVSEGKVALGDNRLTGVTEENEVIVLENQRGSLNGDSGPVVSEVTDMEWYLGWTEGRLVFEDRPLSEVIPRLERWYAVDIVFEGRDAGAKKITAEIDYSQPMGEVLEGMALSLDLEFRVDERLVTFYLKDQEE